MSASGEHQPFSALTPTEETQAAAFLRTYPDFNGRGVVVAVLDTGVDPGAAGLQWTPEGRRKIIDMVECTGSGDVCTRTRVRGVVDGDRVILQGASGRRIILPHHAEGTWACPAGEWRVGCKLEYELYPSPLVQRVRAARAKARDVRVRGLTHTEASGSPVRADDGDATLDGMKRMSVLNDTLGSVEDVGRVLDVVAWHDGVLWRVCVCVFESDGDGEGADTRAELDMRGRGIPLASYRNECQYAVLSRDSLMNYAVNVYDDGDVVSIVTDAGSHGTHVAGIVAACHDDCPSLNGVAPGAHIVSIKIGDTRLGSMETGTGLMRAMRAVVDNGVHIINMSYGEPTSRPAYGRFMEMAAHVARQHGIIFVSSAGNNGPALSTVGAPGGVHSDIIGVAAAVTQSMMTDQYALRKRYSALADASSGPESVDNVAFRGDETSATFRRGAAAYHSRALDCNFTWSSRGPTADGAAGVSICAPGAAITSIPTWNLAMNQLMNGTSMSSPNAAGCIALILSAVRAQEIPYDCQTIRRAIENTAAPLASGVEVYSTGRGMIQVLAACQYLQLQHAVRVAAASIAAPYPFGTERPPIPSTTVKLPDTPLLDVLVPNGGAGSGEASDRGIYLRDAAQSNTAADFSVSITPWWREGADDTAKVAFQRRLRISTTTPAWVSLPDHVLVMHGGRSFSAHVDPRALATGLHLSEIQVSEMLDPRIIDHTLVRTALREQGVDSITISELEARLGPLLRVPVTVVKPEQPKYATSGCVYRFLDAAAGDSLHLHPGALVRRFLAVPIGATWAEVVVRRSDSGGDDASRALPAPASASPEDDATDALEELVPLPRVHDVAARMIVVHCVQVVRHVSGKHTDHERYCSLRPADADTLAFPVHEGSTLEVDIGQFWNSLGTSTVTASVFFRGVSASSDRITMLSSIGTAEMTVTPLLHDVVLKPVAKLMRVRQLLVPTTVEGPTMLTARDTLADDKRQFVLNASYKLSLTEAVSGLRLNVSRIHGVLYESPWDSQIVFVRDSKGRTVGTSDSFPASLKLSKGEYSVVVSIRAADMSRLEGLKRHGIPLEIVKPLASKDHVSVAVSGSRAGAVVAGEAFGSKRTARGKAVKLFLHVSGLSKFQAGDSLEGALLLEDYSLPGAAASLPSEARDSSAFFTPGRHPTGIPVVVVMTASAALPDAKPKSDAASGGPITTEDVLLQDVSDLLVAKLKGLRGKSLDLARAPANPLESLLLPRLPASADAASALSSALLSLFPSASPAIHTGLLEALDEKDAFTVPTAKLGADGAWEACTWAPRDVAALHSAIASAIAVAGADELAMYFGVRHDEVTMSAEEKKVHKRMQERKALLVDALTRRARSLCTAVPYLCAYAAALLADADHPSTAGVTEDAVKQVCTATADAFTDTLRELAKWADVTTFEHLVVEQHLRTGRWHACLQVLNRSRDDAKAGMTQDTAEALRLCVVRLLGWKPVEAHLREALRAVRNPGRPMI